MPADATRLPSPTTEPIVARLILIAVAVTFLACFLVLPLFAVFAQAFAGFFSDPAKAVGRYLSSFEDPDTVSAIWLTVSVALIAVPANIMFGLAASWAIAKFEFKGKSFLITLIDLPFSVSPVVSGMCYVILFGANGYFGHFVQSVGWQIVFAVPGIVLATIFVTFPFVARELIPLMQEQGTSEEEAALSLGAGGFRTFWSVTLPNVRWALLYGVLLCNARAMGEFGAVSVVSGHLRGLTNTIPLQVEILYNDYNFVAAFAVASVLASLGLVTLAVKAGLEWRYGDEISAAHRR